MSRELPSHPNLDHLKKQARRRLRDLQRHYPKAKLADAQHSIAREYGLASWPELKIDVESRRDDEAPAPQAAPASNVPAGGGGGAVDKVNPPPDYGFGRYSMKAREALFFSRSTKRAISEAPSSDRSMFYWV